MDYLPCEHRKNYCNLDKCNFKCRNIDVWCDYSNECYCCDCEYYNICILPSKKKETVTLEEKELEFYVNKLIALSTVENAGYKLNSFIGRKDYAEYLKDEKERVLKRINKLRK